MPPARPPRPAPPAPPTPPVALPPPASVPAPAPAPAPPVRRRRPARRFSAVLFWIVVGALAALFAANLAGYGPALVQHEKVRVVLPPQRQTQPAQSARRLVAPKPQVTAPAIPHAPSVATPVTSSASVDINVNINVRTPQQSVQPVATLCPKVGYYVLSHEPTTDHRQFDDRGNWISGHMELIRECRNGALHEFPRWVGHHLPSAPAPFPYYIPPQAP